MDKKPTCTCGSGEEGAKKRIIFACSGASNVGELSNAASVVLTKEGFGSKACTASLAIKTPSVMKKSKEADEIVIIDGCPVGCANQIAEASDVEPDQYIVITDLDIKKIGDMDLNEDDLEKVVSATWEGKGTTTKVRTPKSKPEGEEGETEETPCVCGGNCR